MGRFCAKCGVEYSEGRVFIGNLCLKCYLEENPLMVLPRLLRLKICRVCGAVRSGSTWVRGESVEEVAHGILKEQLETQTRSSVEGLRLNVALPPLRDGEYAVDVEGHAEVEGVEVRQRGMVRVRITTLLCPDCSRKTQGSFEATVQVRSVRGRISRADLKRLEDALNMLHPRHLDKIVSVDEVDDGVDIKTLDHQSARAIAGLLRNLMGAKTVETFKVVGMDRRGKRKSRLTISARLPFYRLGDVVVVEGVPAVVEDIRRGKVYYRRLDTGSIESVSLEKAWEGAVAPVPDDAYVLNVIYAYKDDKFAYLIDPENPENTLQIPLSQLPEGLKVGGELKVLVVGGKPYVLE